MLPESAELITRLQVSQAGRTLDTFTDRAEAESFSGWTETFTDPRLCAANGIIIETGTHSYRLASTRARAEAAAG